MNRVLNKVNLSKYKSIFFDCDGVIYHLNTPIQSSIDALNRLDQMGKKLYFITNNSTKSRSQIAAKLGSMGYPAKPVQAYTSSTVAPLHLRTKYPSVKKVFVIGMPSLTQALIDGGYEVVHMDTLQLPNLKSYEEMKELRPDPSIDAVVVGLDLGFTYLAGAYASMCVQSGVPFIATNSDAYFKTPGGKVPGNGTLISFLEVACDKKAEIIGKPERFMFDAILEETEINREEALMVGDRLNTDVKFGNGAGVDTLLVETGAHSKDDIEKLKVYPTYVLSTLSDILK